MKNSKYFFFTFLVFALINTQDAWSDVNDTVIQQKKMAATLSDSGFFDDLNLQSPTAEVLPYQLITPLFSDYADKLSFISIPTGGFAASVPDKVFDFPEGSFLIKNFCYFTSHD